MKDECAGDPSSFILHTSSFAERRCWAEINLDALRHNARVVREQVRSGVRIMAIVKADAYGHGVRDVVRALDSEVEMFGVASAAEALEVRAHLPNAELFILGAALAHERDAIVRERFMPPISSLEEARAYSDLARGEPVRAHLVIDTGMGRIGVWKDQAIALAREIAALPNVEISGIATHLPVADEDETFTEKQLREFEELAANLAATGIRAPLLHSLNGAGVIRFSKHAGSMVRAGLMLYGSSPIPDFQKQLRPVLTWKTRVTLVREFGAGRGISYGRTFITPRSMRVATLAVGYADGYRRHLSNRDADVLIRGQRCAVLGRVTMDQIMADVSALPEAQAGDEAVLIGKQGAEEILASELAKKSGTIAWEIFTGIGRRVERAYTCHSERSEARSQRA